MTPTTTERLTAREVLARLDGVQRSGDGWVARCPAHDDKSPSLKVSEGRDGRVLMHCHARCSFDAIVAALGLEPAQVAGSAEFRNGHATRPAGSPGVGQPKPPAEDYDYEDENGDVLFRVTRYYVKGDGGEWAKRFVQKRPDGSGGFVNGLGPGVRRVPYNLPAVLAAIAAGEPVYVVEGEKDVHTLRAWGLVGTCNAGGAGKWDPAFAAFLGGARVVVLPDNDEPGRKHAEAVALSLRGTAAAVAVVRLPGLPEKGDVTDWARLGHTAKELDALAAEAEPEAGEELDAAMVRRPLHLLPDVSPDAIAHMPTVLSELCGFYAPGIDRTVALTSALSILSGMLPRVRVQHFDRDYRTHLMFCLVARSGGGKYILEQVRGLGRYVDMAVHQDSKRAQEQWEDEAAYRKKDTRGPGAKMDRPKPMRIRYFLPANASKTYLLNAVLATGEACDGSACIVETEIDTLIGADEQEWGNFSDLLRKAFQHEGYRMGRMGSGDPELMVIEDPSLALAISGTWGQFERMFAGANLDNGLFNRFCYFVSTAPPRYRSGRPTPASVDRERWMKDAARDVAELYDCLAGRSRPLTVGMREAEWDRIDAVFGPAYDEAAASPHAERVLPFVQRLNLMAVRLVGILTVLRTWDQHGPLDSVPHLVAIPFDVRLALHVTSIWYQHGYALLTHLSKEDINGTSPLMSLSETCRALYEALPGTFRRADANREAERLGASERTVKKYMSDLQAAGLVLLSGHTYTKVTPPDDVFPFDPAEDD